MSTITTKPDVTLESVICFSLDAISLWSGRRRLSRADIRAADDDLPPQDVASLGSKKVIDPQEISDFEAMKKEAHRECAAIGIRFLGGYAVPEAEASTLAKTLDAIAARFDKKKADFLATYDKKVADWVKAHPDWSTMLQEAALDRAEVQSKIHFGYSAFKVATAASDAPDDPLAKGLQAEVGGLASQLYAEIAQAAGVVMEKSLLGRDKVTQKILSPVRTIRKKLFGLSFLDKRVTPLIETIDHILEKLPPAGHIEGMELTALHGLIFILSSTDRMQQHGDLILNGKTVEEAAEESIPGLAEPEEEVEAAPEPVAPVAQQAQDDLFGAIAASPTPAVQPEPAATPTPPAGMVPGFGAGMAHATYAVRKIMAPPPVRARI